MTRPLAVDLFCGAGGLSLGLEQAGFDVAAAVEHDPVHAATHDHNFPQAATFCQDASTVTGAEIRSKSGIGERDIHAVVGGPPCQGFSLIGKRALNDPRNTLLGVFARLVRELQPRFFVCENVAGLAVGEHRRLLEEFVGELDQAGYRVVEPVVLQAGHFAVPQSRRRLFVVGARCDVPTPELPEPRSALRRTNGATPADSSLPLGPSVMDALGDLPDIDLFDVLLDSDETPASFTAPSVYAAVLRGLQQDHADYSHPRPHDPMRLTSSARTTHTSESVLRFARTMPGTVEPVSRFLRLHPDGCSNTLRAGSGKDHGGHTAPRPIHPARPRVITVREAARLHGYPDWFRFHATKWHGFRQVGNSVPPPLGRVVAAELLRADHVAPEPGCDIPLGDPALLRMSPAQAARFYQDR